MTHDNITTNQKILDFLIKQNKRRFKNENQSTSSKSNF